MQQENVYYSTNKYANLKDENIIELIKNEDEQALAYLLEKYKDIVNIKASKYYMIGSEKEDMIQEGMIGLFKAIKDFKNDKQNTFKTFANMCIERQMITAAEMAISGKTVTIDKNLSKFEKQVLNRYIKGESYVAIADKLEAPVKSVDNAIQRIRKKAITNLFK